jgi:hypothetical protein
VAAFLGLVHIAAESLFFCCGPPGADFDVEGCAEVGLGGEQLLLIDWDAHVGVFEGVVVGGEGCLWLELVGDLERLLRLLFLSLEFAQ